MALIKSQSRNNKTTAAQWAKLWFVLAVDFQQSDTHRTGVKKIPLQVWRRMTMCSRRMKLSSPTVSRYTNCPPVSSMTSYFAHYSGYSICSRAVFILLSASRVYSRVASTQGNMVQGIEIIERSSNSHASSSSSVCSLLGLGERHASNNIIIRTI